MEWEGNAESQDQIKAVPQINITNRDLNLENSMVK